MQFLCVIYTAFIVTYLFCCKSGYLTRRFILTRVKWHFIGENHHLIAFFRSYFYCPDSNKKIFVVELTG